MKIEQLINQKKPLAHIIIALIAIVAVLFVILKNNWTGSLSFKLGFFLLLFIQIEVFIFIASLIFKELPAGLKSKEFTMIILVRLILFLVACFIVAFVISLIHSYLIVWFNDGDLSVVVSKFIANEFEAWATSTMKGLSFGAVIFVFVQWQDALKREQKLIEENLIFLNQTLQNQINPHFLFNSLNTISSLIHSHPGEAEKFITRLSSIYRYILENSRKNKVSLAAELDFVGEYVDIHRTRGEDKIILTIDTPGAGLYEIIPVSLQILVENAIKHNIATRDNPLTIEIYIENSFVVIRNNIQKMDALIKSTKTGLKNLSERISLTTGTKLVIEESDSYFTVKVPLMK